MTLASWSLLTACGGGETLELNSSDPSRAATVHGVAAMGAPVAGAEVEVRCVSGAALTTTTDAQGAFRVTVSGQRAPCVLRVQAGTVDSQPQADTLYSALASFGRANVTPLTDLLLARVAEGDPAAFFESFAAGPAAQRLSASAFTTAQTALLPYLQALGVDTAALADFPFVTGAFTATAGDPHDATLEHLRERLAANALSLQRARSDVALLAMPGPCANATGFCWPLADYKLLTENRTNDKGEPEVKFHEHDVNIHIDAQGQWVKTVVLKADKVGKVFHFDLTRPLSFLDSYRPGLGSDCSALLPAGESCYQAVHGAVLMVCGAALGDDVVLMPSATVQKDSTDEVKKGDPSALHGLQFERVAACAPTASRLVVDALGQAWDESGAPLGPIANLIGKTADKRLERKFWRVSHAGQTRYVGIESGNVGGQPQFAVWVSR
ncbi:MAG: carboxypeptidase-like regulatory domain-containing protein [Caldimonas sp.]|uniref:carboxypeptidase-like regulatory domain-containing protein n=1 Tax=Caldimonas sp. TaxID=2838790 RepID=UPI00391DE290